MPTLADLQQYPTGMPRTSGTSMTPEQLAKLRDLAGRLQINSANAKSMGKLAIMALQNPGQYQELRKKAIRVGYSNIPEKFDKKWLSSIVLLANSVGG